MSAFTPRARSWQARAALMMARAVTPSRPAPVRSLSSPRATRLPQWASTMARQAAPQSASSICRMTGIARLMGRSPWYPGSWRGPLAEHGVELAGPDVGYRFGAQDHGGLGARYCPGARRGLLQLAGYQDGGLLQGREPRVLDRGV